MDGFYDFISLVKHQRFFLNLKVRRSLFQQCIVFHRMWLLWPNHRTHLEFGCLNFNFSIMEAIQISEKVKKQVQLDRSVYRFDVCFCLLLIYFAKYLAISPGPHFLTRDDWQKGECRVRSSANQNPSLQRSGQSEARDSSHWMADYTQACSRDQCMWGSWSCDQ